MSDDTIRMQLRQIARENIDEDPEILARKHLHGWTKAELVPLIAREIQMEQRRAVRGERDEAFRGVFMCSVESEPTLPTGKSSLDAFRDLFGREVALGDGQRLPVEEVLDEQWLIRRDMLARNRVALDAEIAVCEEAIRLCKVHRVRRLKDIT